MTRRHDRQGRLRPTDEQCLAYIARTTAQLQRTLAAGPVIDPDAIDALKWRVQGVIETANHLSAEVRGRHPEVAWSTMRSSRNHLAHDHLMVDDATAELVARHVAPVLAAVADAELSRHRRLPSAALGVEGPASGLGLG